jgi:glycosyltransferase involved in cell wall biosynthesis
MLPVDRAALARAMLSMENDGNGGRADASGGPVGRQSACKLLKVRCQYLVGRICNPSTQPGRRMRTDYKSVLQDFQNIAPAPGNGMLGIVSSHPLAAVTKVGTPKRPLPRVLYAIAMDGSQKFGSLEEQIFFLAQAFRDEGSLLLPLFVEPSGACHAHARPVGRQGLSAADGAGMGMAHHQGGTQVFEAVGLPTASMTLWDFRWKKLIQLYRLIARHQIQLVHWNFYPPVFNSYVWGLSALRPGVKHYFTDHNSRLLPLPRPPGGFSRWLRWLLLKRYRKVWCVSQFVQDCLTRQHSWSNLECCLHFINTDRFRPDAEVRAQVRRDLGCTHGFVVLAVANLIREKGIDVLLRAMPLTPEDVRLWVVGTGGETAALQALRDELGLRERVRFFGQQALVQPYMQAADCLACPSLWAEAAGLVNLEALSTGLPVLASRIGGIPEYVEDGTAGYLFPPGDHQALAELIRRLHDHPELCSRLGAAARATAVRRFSVPAKINDYLDLYRMYS